MSNVFWENISLGEGGDGGGVGVYAPLFIVNSFYHFGQFGLKKYAKL